MRRAFAFCIVLPFILFWGNCLHAQNPDALGGQNEVLRGSRALVTWRFDSYDYVKVMGDTTHYPKAYQVYVAPQQTTTYIIRAYRQGDSTEKQWTIRVIEPNIPNEAKRGPEATVYSVAPRASTEHSSYYIGYQQQGSDSALQRVRVVYIDHSDSNNKTLNLHTVLLDANGNQLSSLPIESLTVGLVSKCNDREQKFQPLVGESKWLRSDLRCMMTVCMDRSSYAEKTDAAVQKAVSDFPFYMGGSDKLSIVCFNQESSTLCQHLTKDKLNNVAELFSGDAKGLSAMFKSVYSALGKFDRRDRQQNVLVLVCNGGDNASLVYTADDVIQRALQKRCIIFTIGIGDMVDSYPLRYLASQTGGRYYSLSSDNTLQLTGVLREINYATHGSYLLQVPLLSRALQSCDSASLRLSIKAANEVFNESFDVFGPSSNAQPSFQALSLFEYNQSTVSAEYNPLLKSLAQVLKDNPKKTIELCGNASNEGSDDAMRDLALQRVRNVRKALSELGVNPTQVRGKAMGDIRPLFYFQTEDWKLKFNRRVEVRWIDPSLLPFELIAEYCYTENDALKFCEQWEKRGYKTYYERVRVSGTPAFRVKLWGYDTEVKANTEAQAIEKKYHQKVSVE